MKFTDHRFEQTGAFYKYALYLIIPFCGFYTVKIGISPIYVTFSLSLFFIFISSIWGFRRVQEPFLIIIAASIILYAVLSLVIYWSFDYALPSAWVNLVFSLVYFVVTLFVLDNVSKDKVNLSIKLTIVFSIILLTIELAYRLLHPEQPEDWVGIREDIEWYMYKTASFMYPDSNSVGLFISCLIGFIIGIPDEKPYSFRKYLIPLFLLLLGTLSRSSIFAAILAISYQFLNGSRFKSFLIIICSIFGIAISYSLIETDESFLSKFWIASLVLDYLHQADILQLMIGVGPGNAEKYLGVGAHLLPFILLIETGLVGTVLIVLLWISIWKKLHRHGTPIFIVLLVNGLSFSTFAIPWFYAMLATLIYCSRVKINARLCSNSCL